VCERKVFLSRSDRDRQEANEEQHTEAGLKLRDYVKLSNISKKLTATARVAVSF
jgi:hypothetical protein